MPRPNTLTHQQERFCDFFTTPNTPEFANASAAYMRAYNLPMTHTKQAGKRADALMKIEKVKARIDLIRKRQSERVEFGVKDVLKQWVMIATANVNDLVQHRRNCCRYCYGENHQYQWIQLEYSLECAKAIEKELSPPEIAGGFGFNALLPPHSNCPSCFGEGKSEVFIADTRKLTGAAKVLYGGMKRKDKGFEIVLRNQDLALENIAKFLGMFKDGASLPDDKPLTGVSEITSDPVEAAKIYQRAMG